jgi:hypothetical protein
MPRGEHVPPVGDDLEEGTPGLERRRARASRTEHPAVYYVLREIVEDDIALPAEIPDYVPVEDAYTEPPEVPLLFDRLRGDFEILVFKVSEWDKDGRPKAMKRAQRPFRLVPPAVEPPRAEPT